MKTLRRPLLIALGGLFGLALLGALTVLGAYLYVAPSLPSVEMLKDVRLQEPMRVFTRDGRLIAEFGEQKRAPLAWEEMPQTVINAFLAAEDDRFFQHPGVDYQGLLRAGLNHLVTGDRSQGGGTITMQLTREFFLTREKTYIRKLREIFLAFRIEHELSKEEILTLYLNKIFLGNRAYGVAAASQVYFDKDVREISVAQAAALAATAQRPSANNPVSNTPRLLERRAYVLGRLRHLGWIAEDTFRDAMAEPLVARVHGLAAEVEAPYVAEMVRAEMVQRYGLDAYEGGLRVYASIDAESQAAANRALRHALHDYDFRHGYRGPVARHELDDDADDADEGDWDRLVAAVRSRGPARPALVVDVGERDARAYLGGGRYAELPWSALSWARPAVDDTLGPMPQQAADVVARGDLVYLLDLGGDHGLRLAQLPRVQGALVAVDAHDGGIRAMVGGYDFFASQYNRAVQSTRQPGSSFKPFIYSAALERGFTAASVVNDAPVVFEEDEALERDWRPRNDSGRFYGPTRLREALTYSRNLVSVRVMRSIGVPYTVNFMQRFGFERGSLPRDLSLSLGSGAVSPREMAAGFATFANGGFRVEPWLIARIEDTHGVVLYEAEPPRACLECEQELELERERDRDRIITVAFDADADGDADTDEVAAVPLAERVISAENAFLMDDMLRDVVRRGTGRRALELGRGDAAGKTGSTNDHTDAWFVGYTGGIVAAAWVGFDNNQPLGTGEFGGRAALPMWIEFMRGAVAGAPEAPQLQPAGLVTARISPETGRLATQSDTRAIFEYFRAGDLARLEEDARSAVQRGDEEEDERDETILF